MYEHSENLINRIGDLKEIIISDEMKRFDKMSTEDFVNLKKSVEFLDSTEQIVKDYTSALIRIENKLNEIYSVIEKSKG